MRSSIFCLVTLVSFSVPARGQFVVPLPRSISGADTGYRVSRIRNDFMIFLRDRGQLTPEMAGEAKAAFCASVDQRANQQPPQAADGRLCRDSLQITDAIDTAGAARLTAPYRRWLLKGFARPREDLLPLYDSAGAGGFSALTRFSTNVTDDRMFLLSELFSGLVGQFIVAVSHAAIVTSTDGEKAVGDTVAITDLASTEDNTATMMRLVNNGGTVSLRVQAPFVVGGGASMQQAASVYLQAGMIGPMGNTDSLRASAALVLEYMAAFTARKPNRSYDVEGDLLAGLRLGTAWSEDEFLPSSKRSGMWFLQGALGLRKGATVTASLLVTLVDRTYRDFVPRLVINFSALR